MSSPVRKFGPRFARHDAAPRIQQAARRVISEYGIGGLSFRAVGGDKELRVSHSAPLHHFGTLAGLLGAVAAEEFEQLASKLNKERRSGPPSVQTLERMARCYAAFALESPRVYEAIHSPGLWNAHKGGGTARPVRENAAGDAALKRQNRWIEAAVAGRDRAFGEFEGAVADLAESGLIRHGLRAEDIAHMVTALVDGYLFHVLNEQVDTELPLATQVAKLGRLVKLALQGAQSSSR